MLFMVVERFRRQDAKAVYRRLRDHGRLMPDDLTFVASYVQADLACCYQVVECDDVATLQNWVAHWTDLVEFEILPIAYGRETAEALAEHG